MALTQKQEKFCHCIVSGMTAKDSYLTAYDGKSEKAAEIESTKLMKRDEIVERIAELNKPIINLVQSQAITARQERIEFILERIEICKQKDDENSLIRWNDQLNKILALYKESDQDTSKENPLETLDKDKLRRLLA